MEINELGLMTATLHGWYGHNDEYKLAIFRDGRWKIMYKNEKVTDNICVIDGARLDSVEHYANVNSLIEFIEAYAEGYFKAINDLNSRHMEEFCNLWKGWEED